jgi:hypothetical protein
MRMQAEALANVQAHLGKAAKIKQNTDKVHFRKAAGTKWVDPTLSEWPEGELFAPLLLRCAANPFTPIFQMLLSLDGEGRCCVLL